MALWPRDERIKGPTGQKRNTGMAKEQHRDYPYMRQGLIGAATLLEAENKRLQWTFLNKPSSYAGGCIDKRVRFGKQLEVFPATTLPTTTKTLGTIRQRAEQGANFLRTYVPDAEIPEELIRAHLVEDTTWSRQMEIFDPYEGNTLEILQDPVSTIPSILVFPTGQTKEHLSYTQLKNTDDGITFEPSATPLHTFATPIQQIVSNKANGSAQDSLFCARTFTMAQIFKLTKSECSLGTTCLASLTPKDTNGESIVDMAYLTNVPKLVMIGSSGTLFSCDIENGGMASVLHTNIKDIVKMENELWRVSTSDLQSQYFITSDTQVFQVDERANSSSQYFSLLGGKNVFTSAEDVKDNRLCLCTTESVIWMDTRFPAKPLLSYAHGRAYNRYLSTHTLHNLTDTSLTFLTSRNDSLVQVFDINQPSDALLHFETSPYTVPSVSSSYQANISHCYVQHQDYTGLGCLLPTGGVSYTQIIAPGVQTEIAHNLHTSEDILDISVAKANTPFAVGPLEVREYTEVDLENAYNALFHEHFIGIKEREEEDAEAVYQMLDYFPSFFQNKEMAIETMLTTYDVAFRAGDEPGDSRGADFFTNSLVCSKRGLRALKQGKLAPELIKASWKRSITPTLQELDPDFSPNMLDFAANLSQYKLANSEYTSPKVREYEQDAAQELTLDLALSSHIYSDSSISHRKEADQSLELMTEALSLGSSPPQVQFGYLKPVRKGPVNYYDREANKTSTPLDIPLGVRSLLQGWDSMSLGDYTYQDPYGETDAPLQTRVQKPDTTAPPPIIFVQSQRPPQVLTSNVPATQPDIPRRPMPIVQSQSFRNTFPEKESEKGYFASSQPSQNSFPELMISTQVLPGPHGGRPAGKKKPAKKRLGGF